VPVIGGSGPVIARSVATKQSRVLNSLMIAGLLKATLLAMTELTSILEGDTEILRENDVLEKSANLKKLKKTIGAVQVSGEILENISVFIRRNEYLQTIFRAEKFFSEDTKNSKKKKNKIFTQRVEFFSSTVLDEGVSDAKKSLEQGKEEQALEIIDEVIENRGCKADQVKRLINCLLSILNEESFSPLLNDTIRRRLRKNIKRLAELQDWSIVHGKGGTEGRLDNGVRRFDYELREQEILEARLSKRTWRGVWRTVGRTLGFVMALGCGVSTAVAILPFVGLLGAMFIGIAGVGANFYLFWGSTPKTLITLFSKKASKGLFRGLDNGVVDTTRKVAIIFSLFLSTATGASVSSLTFIFTLKGLAVLSLFVPGSTVVVAVIFGIATLFGITSMMFASIAEFIRTPWRSIKLGFKKLFWPQPGDSAFCFAHVFQILITGFFFVMGVVLGTLAAIATLGVMHHSAIQVLQKMLPVTSLAATERVIQLSKTISAIVVYGFNGPTRTFFSVSNAMRFFSVLGRGIVSVCRGIVGGVWCLFAEPKKLFGDIKTFFSESFLTINTVKKALLTGFVGINAMGNAALTHLHSGVVLLTHVLNYILGLFTHFQLPEQVDSLLAGVSGGSTSLSVTFRAAMADFNAEVEATDDVLEMYYSSPVSQGISTSDQNVASTETNTVELK